MIFVLLMVMVIVVTLHLVRWVVIVSVGVYWLKSVFYVNVFFLSNFEVNQITKSANTVV